MKYGVVLAAVDKFLASGNSDVISGRRGLGTGGVGKTFVSTVVSLLTRRTRNKTSRWKSSSPPRNRYVEVGVINMIPTKQSPNLSESIIPPVRYELT